MILHFATINCVELFLVNYFQIATNSGPEDCPGIVRKIVSPVSGLSSLDVTLDGATYRLELPVGAYSYHTMGNYENCSSTIEIKGTV